MKLGVMSDTHGRAMLARRAVHALREAGAEALVHCGDVGGPEVLEEFTGWRCWFVWGNTDFPEATWRGELQALGLGWPTGPLEMTLANKRIVVCHGHEPEFHRLLEEARHDYLLHGHTHRCRDERIGRMRIINPGALHRASRRSVALLDLSTDDLEFLTLT